MQIAADPLAENYAVMPVSTRELANGFEVVPHWPIGTSAEQVATIAEISGASILFVTPCSEL